MKYFFLIAMSAIVASSGCSVGFVPTNLKPAKANLEYWDKLGMTQESRLKDAADCGGGYTIYTGFSQETIRVAQLPGETERGTRSRLLHDWERCILNKGYRFTGTCYDNDVSKASPACGAP